MKGIGGVVIAVKPTVIAEVAKAVGSPAVAIAAAESFLAQAKPQIAAASDAQAKKA